MPKKIKNVFYKNLTFEKLLMSHYRARKNKSYKKDVILFEMNLENNIINLLNSIKNGNYKMGQYYDFKVFEPKERTIHSLPYRDRIVHQWYVEEFIKPFIVPKFINSSFACIVGRGTHKANDYIQGFFYNIDPNILYHILSKYISDPHLKKFTHQLIFDGRDIIGDVGIPIGNYTSQFFANIYLNELDQYVKRILKVKYYRTLYG